MSSSRREPRRHDAQGSDNDHPDRLCGPSGPDRQRRRRQPGAAGWQRHRLVAAAPDIAGKRLALLREVVPNLRRVAFMGNVDNPVVPREMREVQAAADTLGLEIATIAIRRAQDVVPAFEELKQHTEALYLASEGVVDANRLRINILALGARLPTMWSQRELVEAGGLMSYGPNFTDQFRRAGDFVDKILRGAKPADLPVEQPVKFDLAVNVLVAKALGLTVPPTLLTRADEVIE